jgi:hypothetical protein
MITLEHAKLVRNDRLKVSDMIIAEVSDPEQLSRWQHYRQLLRDFFVDKPSTYNYETDLVWPKSPLDIDALKEKALAGDVDAQKILEKEQENGTIY